MKDFKTFVLDTENNAQLIENFDNSKGLQQVQSSIVESLTTESPIPDINSSEVVQFSEKITQIVTSDFFISQISKDIGMPQNNETEDQFVRRALEIIRQAITKTL